jgi:uroporphyrinogen-III synthase
MSDRPLAGRRIAITRAEEQASGLAEHLRALGAEPLVCPAIAIVAPVEFGPLDQAIARLDTYDWLIVTSANGAHALVGRMAALGRSVEALARLAIGAIGPATAEALAEYGLVASFMPSAYVAESILAEIGDVAGKRILLPRADIARETLAAGLRERGACVEEIAAYRTVPGAGANRLAALLPLGVLDALTFTSSSTVRYLLDGLEQAGLSRFDAVALLNNTAIVCIGPITAATAREQGLRIAAVAEEYTAAGLVAALLAWFAAPGITD